MTLKKIINDELLFRFGCCERKRAYYIMLTGYKSVVRLVYRYYMDGCA